MRRLIIQSITVLLAFLAGVGFMNYATQMGNRDMTAAMAEATLPVVYAEKDGKRYNEMHGYVGAMDGSYMKDSVLGLSQDHLLGLAVDRYGARIKGISYEVRSLDMGRLIENGDNLQTEDDGEYLHFTLDFKDLMQRNEKYLLILKMVTDAHEEICYYSQLCYLGENHVKECVDFAQSFHEMALQKNSELYRYLEVDGSMDGMNLGYVNIHSNSGPVTWGDMQVERVTEPQIQYTDFYGDKVSLVMEYQLKNMQTEELYQVSEAFCVQYTSTRMYLLAYERTAEHIFAPDRQLVEDGRISLGIQGKEINFRKNDEENVIGFVQQGQLWSYDFGQNRLSMVYGFTDGDDKRGLYNAHDFRILQVEDSGSMDFLVYGYMNRGRYEGRTGILICRYDALLNTVEERCFLQGDYPYQMLKEEIGSLAAVNGNGLAWLSYRGMILQIDLSDASVTVLAQNIREEELEVSPNGLLAAWRDPEGASISLLNIQTGIINEITTGAGEILQALGFMEEDFIYGAAYEEDIRTDLAGRRVLPLYKVVIRDHYGNEVREFDYASKGKYVTDVSIVENRIDLSCVTLTESGSYEEARPEPITYTSEPINEKLRLVTASDEVKRNEYRFAYEGTIKNGSMKRPRVKLVLFEENRTLTLEEKGRSGYFAHIFTGEVQGFDTLSEAIIFACNGNGSDDGMGEVWKDGSALFWRRWKDSVRMQLSDFEIPEAAETSSDSVLECLQTMLRRKQIYTDVQAKLEAGLQAFEICEQELKESCCLIPGCSLSMALYYVDQGAPVLGVREDGTAVLIVGFDPQNIVYYEPGQPTLKKEGLKDSTTMFENAGNLFLTYLP